MEAEVRPAEFAPSGQAAISRGQDAACGALGAHKTKGQYINTTLPNALSFAATEGGCIGLYAV